ncbi:hypothetical protein [Methylomicrobium sp. Wu6]|uniref:hypothetical protein n=1 Tax=Methylomicrobium sp. Wu6 TaxID=3107928 RepID=UPI002DD670EF|nr:hypothetical protein [Methylomicrobium sp. Wu6]MEC4747828.1 hypothetical protein [Methylomicrobium sp. Wu6]
MKNSFYLVIPKQEDNPQRIKEYEAKPLQQWIDEIPAANPGLATRLLHDFIIEFNALLISAELRMAALEQLRPSFLAIEENLRSRLTKTGFPKEENDQKIFNVLVSIEKELTLSYWIVLKELSQKNFGWFQGKQLPLALHRCISGLSGIAISHYLMRMPIPDWIWIDLHSLYKLSIALKKDTAKVVDDPANPSEKSSPEDCYKRILLLSLTAPNGLMQKEILLVYQFIRTLCEYLHIKNTPVSGQATQCVILTDEDKAPYFLKEDAGRPDSATLYLDFTKLHKMLEHKAKHANSSEGRFNAVLARQNEQTPTFDLLEYLFHRWSGFELESTRLFDDRLDRYIAIGLIPTYELLNELTTMAGSETELPAHTASESLLSSRFEQTGILSVGRLISIRKADRRDNTRTLGIVNQLLIDKQTNKVIFGVQFLAAQCNAVTYSPLDSSKKEEPVKALLYAAEGEDGDKSYLITDNFILKNGDVARIHWKNEDYPVSLHERKNIGLGYWQFQCVKIMEKTKFSTAKKGYDFI